MSQLLIPRISSDLVVGEMAKIGVNVHEWFACPPWYQIISHMWSNVNTGIDCRRWTMLCVFVIGVSKL